MADAFAIKFSDAGMAAGLDALTDGALKAVRPAAQAGAQVFYEEVLARVPVSRTARKTKSGRVIAPGALKASIYQVFSEDNSAPERATYHISWNAKKAPHGHLVEYGTSRAPAHPFIRPSFDAKAQAALEASRVRYGENMQAVIGSLT